MLHFIPPLILVREFVRSTLSSFSFLCEHAEAFFWLIS